MDLREIDKLVAERVMGWADIDRKMSGYCPDGNGSYYWNCVPRYSDSIEAAWEVWIKLHASRDFCCMDIRMPIHEGVEIALARVGTDHVTLTVRNDSAPLAICLAALKAKGVEVPA